MLPSRPAPGPSSPIQKTLGYEDPSKGSKRTLAYDGTPHQGPAPSVQVHRGASAFDATIVEQATPHAPTLPVETAPVSGFEATMLGGTSPLATTGDPQSATTAPAPVSMPNSIPNSSVPPRSTVLPRVELMDGQPRILVQDRPRYQETKRLGEGGVGEVHMARDNDIERNVAVKRLRPELQGSTALARFVEEIRVVGQLEHPSIVPIHDVGLDEKGQFFFVMKYVNGETLENIIEKLAAGDPAYHARYPFERRIEIFIAILEAMAYAHDKGYIHRDIKPANVMVGPYGEVMVMDWGLAKKVGSGADFAAGMPENEGDLKQSGRLQETRVGSILGTPLYMSPEQARGQHNTLDQRSDIYSLSMMFLELLALRHPLHECSDFAQVLFHVTTTPAPDIMGKFWDQGPLQGPVPADLRHTVLKGLHKDPAQRYGSVHELINRLRLRAEGCVDAECAITFWMHLMGKGRRFFQRHPMASISLFSLFMLTSTASMVYSIVHMLRA